MSLEKDRAMDSLGSFYRVLNGVATRMNFTLSHVEESGISIAPPCDESDVYFEFDDERKLKLINSWNRQSAVTAMSQDGRNKKKNFFWYYL